MYNKEIDKATQNIKKMMILVIYFAYPVGPKKTVQNLTSWMTDKNKNTKKLKEQPDQR